MLGDNGRTERSAERYLPYVGHVGPQAVLLDGGGLLAMGHARGQAFELADHSLRNARLRLLNTLYRNLADDNVLIHTYLVRCADDESRGAAQFRSEFAAALDEAYSATALHDRLYRNDYYVALVVLPRSPLGVGARKFWSKFRTETARAADGLARELEDQWLILANGLDNFGLTRLGIYERDGIIFSEIAEALRLIITGRYLRVPIVSGHLEDSIYTDRVICGRRGIEIRAPGKNTFGTIFSFNGLDPEAYLANTIDRMAKGHLAHRLKELLPWNWKTEQATADQAAAVLG